MCLHLSRSSFMSLHKVLQCYYLVQSSVFFKMNYNFDFLGLQKSQNWKGLKNLLITETASQPTKSLGVLAGVVG